jgi:hypothetical protein
MPTENPKISLYLPQEIYVRFKEFQTEKNLSMSMAGRAILAEYFEFKEATERTTVEAVTLAEFQKLSQRVEELERVVLKTAETFLKTKSEPSHSTSNPLNPTTQLVDQKSEPSHSTSNPLDSATQLVVKQVDSSSKEKKREKGTQLQSSLRQRAVDILWTKK